MRKLSLSSVSVATKNQKAFIDLIDKEPSEIKIALIENGADTYPENRREWVERARSMLEAVTRNISRIDLRTYVGRSNELLTKLRQFDMIWVGGGNVFYLRWLSEEVGLKEIINTLLNEGIVYGGDSAGAILVCPTIGEFASADDPEKAPKRFNDGLHIVDFIVVPHADHKKYRPLMMHIHQLLLKKHYQIVILRDDQAVIVKGKTIKVV
ncbi:Type 1 glutamine amidotransferase-like domain-containing protein [Candidatus Saccharibacteria bacterium]|nr:MAG: Type 1 glutamine amidotransferase-like domain-containing protein [Candidatus Saccharibacteria bacterium]